MATLMEQVKVFLNGEEIPIENIHVEIVSKINRHIAATITGRMQAGLFDRYVVSADSESALTIVHYIQEQKVLQFEGLIVDIQSETEGTEGANAVYEIKISALSYTYSMDIYKRDESYQNVEMPYDDLLKHIGNRYEDSDFYNRAAIDRNLEMFVLQWKDTDWEFLMREVSKFGEALYVDAREARARLYFGRPEGIDRGELDRYDYTISKNLKYARDNMDNMRIEEQTEFDYIRYTIFEPHATETFSLADTVTYLGVKLYICEIYSEIKDYKLYHTYILTTEGGLKRPRIYNEDLQGLSLVGKVIDVEKNLLKLHLYEIDAEQKKEEAYWFNYAAFYATQYAMPELEDIINLHFPTRNEIDAVGLNSFKWYPEVGYHRNNKVVTPNNTSAKGHLGPIDFVTSASDPDVKLFTTPFGRMIEFGPDRICIELNDGTYIIMCDAEGKEGIKIYTKQDIELHADGKTRVSANKKIEMTANEQILMHTGEAQIEMTPGKIELRADDINLNA